MTSYGSSGEVTLQLEIRNGVNSLEVISEALATDDRRDRFSVFLAEWTCAIAAGSNQHPHIIRMAHTTVFLNTFLWNTYAAFCSLEGN
jgi:hypothetical protein